MRLVDSILIFLVYVCSQIKVFPNSATVLILAAEILETPDEQHFL